MRRPFLCIQLHDSRYASLNPILMFQLHQRFCVAAYEWLLGRLADDTGTVNFPIYARSILLA
jgi:hypothetical protein